MPPVFNIDNPYFARMIPEIYPPELTLNRANSSDSAASFLDLFLKITNGTISTKIYDKRDDFDFDIINYPDLHGDVPRATSYGVYISQLVRFARACTEVSDFNERNRIITSKLLSQGYKYHKLRKTLSKFSHRCGHLINKYNTSTKDLLNSGISQHLFYGDVVYKLRKIKSSTLFPSIFPKCLSRYIRRGYDRDILKRTCSLVLGTHTVSSFSSCFVSS